MTASAPSGSSGAPGPASRAHLVDALNARKGCVPVQPGWSILPDQAGVSSVGAAESALPLMYSSQDRFQSVQPLPQSSLRDVPLTTTGSPMCVSANRYLALAVETLVQPCDTLRLPWSPTDH